MSCVDWLAGTFLLRRAKSPGSIFGERHRLQRRQHKTIDFDAGTPGGFWNGSPGDGNITVESDLGGYTYGAGRHAATSINTTTTGGCSLANCTLDGMSSPTIYYDSDGNMACITTRTACDAYAGRSYSWTSFDMVETSRLAPTQRRSPTRPNTSGARRQSRAFPPGI